VTKVGELLITKTLCWETNVNDCGLQLFFSPEGIKTHPAVRA